MCLEYFLIHQATWSRLRPHVGSSLLGNICPHHNFIQFLRLWFGFRCCDNLLWQTFYYSQVVSLTHNLTPHHHYRSQMFSLAHVTLFKSFFSWINCEYQLPLNVDRNIFLALRIVILETVCPQSSKSLTGFVSVVSSSSFMQSSIIFKMSRVRWSMWSSRSQETRDCTVSLVLFNHRPHSFIWCFHSLCLSTLTMVA